jgi:hypothetical protein
MSLIKYTNPDIIICTYKDYFDYKSRIQIDQLIEDKKIEYKIIFDECADIDNTLTQLSSMNIDESLLFDASNQLFVLKEKFGPMNNNSMDVDLDGVLKNEETEKEFVYFNRFPYLGKGMNFLLFIFNRKISRYYKKIIEFFKFGFQINYFLQKSIFQL